MDKIPVTFTHQGREYKGILSAVSGAGRETSQLFHLYVDGFYWGQLFLRGEEWVFSDQKNEMGHLGKEFGEVVMLWYE